MDIRQAGGREFHCQPFCGLGVTRGADNATPELPVSLIAIPARDSGLLNNVAVHMLAVDGGIALFAASKWPFQQCVTWIAERMRTSSGRRALRLAPENRGAHKDAHCHSS